MGKNLATGGIHFSAAYKEVQFLAWYKSGRPKITEFWLRMDLDEDQKRPSKITLQDWMKEWKARAAELDAEVEQGIIEGTVQAKIEMLERHVDTAKEIQNIALKYLRENEKELTANTAVKLLQLGVDIERNSVGVPEALKKMSRMDDETIMTEIKSIIKSSEITIEALEAEVEDANNNP